jgi:hypothetical protein
MDRKRIARIARRFLRRTAAKWEDMPKGWSDASREKFWNTLTGDVKHKVTKCIKKMEGKGGIDDPGAFCASLADRVEGKGWRSEPRKKKGSLTLTYDERRKGGINFDGRKYVTEASQIRVRKLPGTITIQNRQTGDTDLFSNPRPMKDREGDITHWTYKGTGGKSLVIFND